MSSPQVIVLSDAEEAVLAARARSVRTEHRDRVRARIVLGAAAGRANTRIAAEVGVSTDTVRTWSRRFATDRLAGLKDAPWSGRPPLFTGARAEVVALACTLPAETGVPLSTWSCPELARELAERCDVTVSASTDAGGWQLTRSSRGSTGPGSRSGTLTSRPRQPACSTSTPGSGTASPWVATTS